MRNIVIFDSHGGDNRYFKQAFRNVFNSEITCTKQPLNEVTAKEYKDADIVSVFVTSEVTSRVIDTLPNLELISTRSTGFDHIDLAAARKNHVLVSTVPSYGENTVAEYAFMLLLGVARKLNESRQQVDEGVVEYRQLIGADLKGKTIGLLGCGRIGQQVARIARGFEMEVLGYDPNQPESEHVSYTGLEDVLAKSDFISLHLPSNKQTHHIIDKAALRQMKKGVILINTARGELIDTAALTEALYSGQVAGAGLDVIEGEELLRFDEEISLLHPEARSQDLVYKAEHSILQRMPQVILTPHNAFNSREALSRIRHTTAENIKQFMMNAPQNLVDKQ